MNNRSFRHQRFLSYLCPTSISQTLTCTLNRKHPIFQLFICFAISIGAYAAILFAMPPHIAKAERQHQLNQSTEISAVVEVTTESPSTANSVQIRTFGLWRNACVPHYSHHVIEESQFGTDSLVLITAIAEPEGIVCGQVETDWDFAIDVDFSSPGLYTIQVEILSEWYPDAQLHTSTSTWVDGAVTFEPEVPETDDDVTITIDGINFDACVPSYESHSMSGSTVVIETVKAADLACGQVPTAWEVTVEMGNMAEGSYAVEAYITSYVDGEPIRELYQSSDLLVKELRRQQQFFYLPGIILQ